MNNFLLWPKLLTYLAQKCTLFQVEVFNSRHQSLFVLFVHFEVDQANILYFTHYILRQLGDRGTLDITNELPSHNYLSSNLL